MSLLSKLQKEKVENLRVIENVELTITGIIPLKEDKLPKDKAGNLIPKSQMVTAEVGSLFPFDSAIINRPASLAFGAKAMVSLEEVTYTDTKVTPNVERTSINVIRVEFLANDETFRAAGKYGVNVVEAKPSRA